MEGTLGLSPLGSWSRYVFMEGSEKVAILVNKSLWDPSPPFRQPLLALEPPRPGKGPACLQIGYP